MRVERLSLKDKQSMKYLLQNNTKTPVTETDASGDVEYIEIDGETVAIETGEYTVGQGEESSDETTDNIVEFYGNISFYGMGNTSFGGGDSTVKEFGIDVSEYDAVLTMAQEELPLTETSYVWYDSEPTYTDEDETIVDVSSADYKVVKVVPSIGFTRYLLKAVVHE